MYRLNYISIILILLILPLITAQDISTTEEDIEAGVTPDNTFAWGIDRALENINLALTFDISKKAEKRLLQARERLLEVKEMIEQNKIEDAEKAEQEHQKTIEKVRIEISSLDENDDNDLKNILEIEDELDEQEDEIEEIRTSVRIKIRGQLTDEQKAKLQEFLDSLDENVDRIRVEIRDKESRTLIRIEQKTGRQREEIIDDIGRLRTDKRLKAEVFSESSLVKVEHRFTTRTTEIDEIINEIIERFAVSEEEANRFLKIENEQPDDDDEDRLRIKVEIREEDNVPITRVRIELRFIDGADKESIISEIVERTQLTKEQIEEVIEIKDKDKDDEDEGENDDEEEDDNDRNETEDDEAEDENDENNDEDNDNRNGSNSGSG